MEKAGGQAVDVDLERRRQLFGIVAAQQAAQGHSEATGPQVWVNEANDRSDYEWPVAAETAR